MYVHAFWGREELYSLSLEHIMPTNATMCSPFFQNASDQHCFYPELPKIDFVH